LGQVTQASPSAGASTDDDLLLAVAGGDQLAFRQLMERHAKQMLTLAQRLTGSADDADEVVQEAFLKVWRLAGRWEVNGAAAFSTWFYRVVFNASLDRRRRAPMAPLEEAGVPVDPAPIGFETAQSKQRRDAIVAAIDQLPKRQKEAVWLYYFGEVSGPEAAQILGMSLSALEALLVRGRRSVKKALIKRGILSLGDIL
jgi:RNA polymerase sigma-70 factor (ECF subfamily)